MYLPPDFREDDVAILHQAIGEARLATLVTFGRDGLTANHLPVLLSPEPAPFGTLVGHLSRGNPQGVEDGAQALAIFLGPDAYVSPSWYPTKRETGKVVPTWNYVAVHAYGQLRTFDDPERLLDLVTRLTARHEGPRTQPWAVADAPADFIQSQLKGIVGLELPIERLEGKWKMSQNRPAQDCAGVVDGLDREGGLVEAAVARLVAERNPEAGRS
ncbi:MAG TPA: FMN-binding negative transcriptional regulator [Chloroflexota bacterium]